MSRVEIISASAGTGKTTKLATLIHEAVEAKTARPEAVLATTFTNRAAAERARETLLQVGEADAAHRLHAARVGTVNGVCGGIVHDFAFLHGLSPRVSVLDERKAQDEPFRAGAEALPRELLNELEDLHARMGPVGAHPGGIMAPGEWDWQQDVVRIVDLARSNAIGADRFPEFAERSTDALLGFLQSPAADADALDRALEPALEGFLANVDLDADTTKKTGAACQRARSALARGARDLPWSEWANLAQLNPGKKSQPHADAVREAAGAHDRHPRLHDDLRRAVRAVFEAAAYVLEAYQAHKRSLGVIDFVDQETEALKLLQEEAAREQLREEIDLVLVDEFQDTSPIHPGHEPHPARDLPRAFKDRAAKRLGGRSKASHLRISWCGPGADGRGYGHAPKRKGARDPRPLLPQPPGARPPHLGALRSRVRRIGDPRGACSRLPRRSRGARGPRSHLRALGARTRSQR